MVTDNLSARCRARATSTDDDRRQWVRRPRRGHPAEPGRARRLRRARARHAKSAAPGATTPTPVRPATCPRTCTRTRSPSTRTGPARSPRSREIQHYIESRRRALTTCATSTSSAATCTGARWNDARRAVGDRHHPGRLHRRHRGLRGRRAVRAVAARHQGHRRLRGRDLPLRALEPRRRPDRQARRGDRHRRLRDPDRARHRAARSRTSTSTSAPRRGCCRASTAPYSAARAARVQAHPRRAAARPAPAIYAARETQVVGLAKCPVLMKPLECAVARQAAASRSRTRTCARRSPRTSGSAASAC